MPSVKWAIAIEKNNTTTDIKPRFLFRELPGLLPKKRRHQRDQRGPLSSKPALDFSANSGSGGSVFPLRGCTTGVRGCPLEGLAGVQSALNFRYLYGEKLRHLPWAPLNTV